MFPVQGFKVASDPRVGAEIGLGFMSMQGPWGRQVILVMVWTGPIENISVALEQVNASLQ